MRVDKYHLPSIQKASFFIKKSVYKFKNKAINLY